MKSRFDVIAETYEAALKKYPDVRTDHVWLLDKLGLNKTDSVLEFAAGSGFLTEKILPLVSQGKLIAQDISEDMLALNRQKVSQDKVTFVLSDPGDFTWSKIAEKSFDKAVCLGGFHHIENQVEILRAVHRKMKKGGLVAIGDFADSSSIQRYFDERIDKLTPTGHQGLFLSKSKMINLGRFAGFSQTEVEEKDVPFIFDSESAIGEFYQLVHGLDQNPKDTLLDIKKYLGIKKVGAKLHVPMPYVYALYEK